MPHILIVDDDHENRLLLKYALRESDYTFTEAGDGEEGKQLALEKTPDLILLDVMMPKCDGLETLRWLKAQEETRGIPVIMCTTLNMDSQVAMFLDEGAVDHLAKPFSRLVAQARVRAALRSKSENTAAVKDGLRESHVVGFVGVKGGVGTTTVALNVAASLGDKGHTVTAVELTSFIGSFSTSLELVDAEPSLAQLASLEANCIDAEQIQQQLLSHPAKFEVLMGPQTDDGYCELSCEHVEAIIDNLAGHSEYTLLDIQTPPGEAGRAALAKCDYIVLVVERELAAVRAAEAMSQLLRSRGISTSAMGAVLVNRAVVSSPLALTYIQEKISCPIIGVFPPDADCCTAATRSGIPFVISQPQSSVADAARKLAVGLTFAQVPAVAF